MTNIQDFTSDQVAQLRAAAASIETGYLSDEQSDFLGFLLRSIANDRPYSAVKYLALQVARTLVPETVAVPSPVAQDAAFLTTLLKQSADLQFNERGRVSKIQLIKVSRTAVGYAGWDDEIFRVNRVTEALDGVPESRNSLAAQKALVEAWMKKNEISE